MEDRLNPAATRPAWLPVATLGLILAITAGWWALALWPVATHPGWLVRTREACFGTGPDGRPGPGGWVLLIGEPVGMLGVLFAVWGDGVRAGLAALGRSWRGRLLLGVTAATVVAGLVAVIGMAIRLTTGQATAPPAAMAALEAVDRPAPALQLVNQWGDEVALTAFHGRPVVVTFAFAHCQTICPTQVHEVLAARRRAAGSASGPAPAVLIVTVDPWRDTPARLPAIAEGWGLGPDEFVLSGSVPSVSAALAAWGVGIARDSATGAIAHPATVYLVRRDGRLGATGVVTGPALFEALRRL